MKAPSASPRVSGFMTQGGLSDFSNITFSEVHGTGFESLHGILIQEKV